MNGRVRVQHTGRIDRSAGPDFAGWSLDQFGYLVGGTQNRIIDDSGGEHATKTFQRDG